LILKYQNIGVLRRSRVMEARVVDLRVVPTEAREMVRIYRDSVLPAARYQHGFRGALLLTDDDTGLGISITLWETEEDRQEGEANGFYQEQIRKFSDLLTETPVRKHYNVGVIHYDTSVLA
jgi:heme-degrading monooxygenase HmoA